MTVGPERIEIELRRAITGGVIAAVIVVATSWFLGRVGGAEGRELLETSLPALRSLARTVTISSSTILALMLTLLGVSTGTEQELGAEHYRRVRQVAFADTMVFVAAMIVSLSMNVPLVESERVPTNWYSTIYFVSLGASAVLGGALISVVLMIYNTLRHLIEQIAPTE